MKRTTLVLMLLLACPALRADEPPYAQWRRSPASLDGSRPSLGNLMTLVQLRHIKLWFAGKAENWDLLSYEVRQIREELNNSAMLYVDIPVELVAATNGPVRRIDEAAREKNRVAFEEGYGELTKACNACHVAVGLPFIRIQTPTSFPFSDQAIGPR